MPKVLLCILDGFGYGKDYCGNAITQAKAPFLKKLYKKYPWTLLHASGEHVGTPPGTQGGSEVGHLTMGAGRIVLQPLLQINQAIEEGSFFKKQALLDAAAHVKSKNSSFHILGMISDQGVHADLNHALAPLDFAKREGLQKVYIHGITDGRDVPAKSVENFITILENRAAKIEVGTLSTLIGRYYAMDRDKNEDRIEKAYKLYTEGKGEKAKNALDAIKKQYAAGLESDYYLEPILLNRRGLIHSEDAVIFFNFRSDRAAELTERFLSPKTKKDPKPYFVVFGPYTKRAPVVFPESKVVNNLGSILEQHGLKQLRIAETEKYAHVTFFFNSQMKDPFKNETRILIDSPKCPSYAKKPEMSADALTNALLIELKKSSEKPYSFIALNFANLDLVGHSGDFQATVKAMEMIDRCLSKITTVALRKNYSLLLTGDHGNAEYMIYEHNIDPFTDSNLDGQACPSHTRNPVPLLLITHSPFTLNKISHKKPAAGLRDLAPTILKLLDLPIPSEMTGHPLVLTLKDSTKQVRA